MTALPEAEGTRCQECKDSVDYGYCPTCKRCSICGEKNTPITDELFSTYSVSKHIDILQAGVCTLERKLNLAVEALRELIIIDDNSWKYARPNYQKGSPLDKKWMAARKVLATIEQEG